MKLVVEEIVFFSECYYLLYVEFYEIILFGICGVVIMLMDYIDCLMQDKMVCESCEILLVIMNNLILIIIFKDLVGCYEFVNWQFENIFELQVDEVIGKIDVQVFLFKVVDDFCGKEFEVVCFQKLIELEDCLFGVEGDCFLFLICFLLFGMDNLVYSICIQFIDNIECKYVEE